MDESSPRVVTSSQKGLFDKIFPHHHFKRPILPLFLFAFIALATGFSVLLAQKNQDVRNYAKESKTSTAQSSSTINLILHLSKNRETGAVSVLEAWANNGYSPTYPQTYNSDSLEQVINGTVDSRTVAQFTSQTFGESYDPVNRRNVNIGNTLPNPEGYVSFQYKKGATLRIQNRKTGATQTLSDPKITTAITNPVTLPLNANTIVTQGANQQSSIEISSPNDAADGYTDLLFISDNYGNNFSQFDSDVDSMVRTLLTIPPYSEYAGKIRITKLHNFQQICQVPYHDANNNVLCNKTLMFQIASQANHDYFVVVENANDSFAWGWYGSRAVIAGKNVWDDGTEHGGARLAHEFGHAIGWLKDEYDLEKNSNQDNEYAGWYYNCDDVSSCAKWSGVSGTSCLPTCSYRDWFRPTQFGMMNNDYDIPIPPFGPLDAPVLRGYLNATSPIAPGTAMPGNSAWKWTTNWCVDIPKTCINAGMQLPAVFYNPSYCSNSSSSYNCSGYQYSGGGPTPTPSGGGSCTITRTNSQTPAVGVYVRFKIDLTSPLSQYSASGACTQVTGGSGDPEPYCGNVMGQNVPSCGGHTQIKSGGTCTVSAVMNNGKTCQLSLTVPNPTPTKEPDRSNIQGNIFHDDETDKNAVKNSNTVEPSVSGVSISLFRVKQNGSSTLIETRTSNNNGKNNFSFRPSQNGNYRFDPPANIPGYRLHPCSQVTKPKNIPTDNRYFYCTETNGNLTLRQWTPNSKNPSKKIASGLIPFTGTTVNVDFPLENAQ